MKVSVIVSTYNWPSALAAVLKSLSDQTVQPYEVIVADDGSTDETAQVIASFGFKHIWHEDHGFRLAEIRNKALAAARGEWVVFLDGDCVCPPKFVERQIKLSGESILLAGNRRLLSEAESEHWHLGGDFQGFIGKFGRMKLGYWPFQFGRNFSQKRWQKLRGCNIGISREDAIAIRGFDESYKGWGREDSDFAVRAINYGLRLRLGQMAVTVLHLYHTEADRSDFNENDLRLNAAINQQSMLPQLSCIEGSKTI